MSVAVDSCCLLFRASSSLFVFALHNGLYFSHFVFGLFASLPFGHVAHELFPCKSSRVSQLTYMRVSANRHTLCGCTLFDEQSSQKWLSWKSEYLPGAHAWHCFLLAPLFLNFPAPHAVALSTPSPATTFKTGAGVGLVSKSLRLIPHPFAATGWTQKTRNTTTKLKQAISLAC